MTAVARLAELLRAEGGLLAGALRPEAPRQDEPLLAQVSDRDYAVTLATVREGYLLHYGEGALIDSADGDLALLGGDRLYALALARLAERGDLAAVERLADLISSCARAHAEQDPAHAEQAWDAAAAAIGPGT